MYHFKNACERITCDLGLSNIEVRLSEDKPRQAWLMVSKYKYVWGIYINGLDIHQIKIKIYCNDDLLPILEHIHEVIDNDYDDGVLDEELLKSKILAVYEEAKESVDCYAKIKSKKEKIKYTKEDVDKADRILEELFEEEENKNVKKKKAKVAKKKVAIKEDNDEKNDGEDDYLEDMLKSGLQKQNEKFLKKIIGRKLRSYHLDIIDVNKESDEYVLSFKINKIKNPILIRNFAQQMVVSFSEKKVMTCCHILKFNDYHDLENKIWESLNNYRMYFTDESTYMQNPIVSRYF
jgi:hypothetical protein